MDNRLPWMGPQAGAGEECEQSSPEDEGEIMSQVKHGKEGGVGGRCLKILF